MGPSDGRVAPRSRSRLLLRARRRFDSSPTPSFSSPPPPPHARTHSLSHSPHALESIYCSITPHASSHPCHLSARRATASSSRPNPSSPPNGASLLDDRSTIMVRPRPSTRARERRPRRLAPRSRLDRVSSTTSSVPRAFVPAGSKTNEFMNHLETDDDDARSRWNPSHRSPSSSVPSPPWAVCSTSSTAPRTINRAPSGSTRSIGSSRRETSARDARRRVRADRSARDEREVGTQ